MSHEKLCVFCPQMELEKAFAEERAVWWTLEERGGTRSANASPRGSLTGARALRRGDFASQRSVSGNLASLTLDVVLKISFYVLKRPC